MKTFRIEVYGRVQGVNFRNTLKSYCSGVGLNGVVWNVEDGSVLIFVQGSLSKIDELVDWIKGNPGFCKVDEIDKKEIKLDEKFGGFEIVRERNYFIDRLRGLGILGKRLVQ